ncbi:hypothetical protein CP09DC78_0834 [Chlamydia psittaci 09DC78]|nr:hypothetical protein CP09DC77_0838 [Chlamydia psittaci 09DC77]EPJ26315.1 hypothetical protein CP09DC80_0839 [Chlamydia psittaci 09DC80]EPJ29735.1 hypothetical protein CP09DC78_0834 [Chlamydia psittaci 09DC78]EPL01079.1 hypothetical protein CP09DC79_0559 [Chlamydia psittaci 09DC79]
MAFPLGNIRSFLGYGEPQEEPNITENTSLVSTVAETVLTGVTTPSTSQESPETSNGREITSSAFVADAGEAAAAALSALDSSLEDIYVDMEPTRRDSASQTDGVTYLEYLKERQNETVVLRDHVRDVMTRSVSLGADLFARSSILTQPRASIECLDDLSLSDSATTPLTASNEEGESIEKSPVLRTQLFSFFIDLLKQDLFHGSISGWKIEALFNLLSGGMSREEYSDLLNLIKEGDFTSVRDITKFCNIIMETPVCKSSNEMQMLFNFFNGEGGAITLVVLHELMGILTETLGLPLPEGINSFLIAIKNLYETTHPDGVSNVATAVSILSLVSGVLQSETTRRVMQSCYDGCADSCSGNCGCVSCGCAEGAGGCGGFGSLLCGLFAGCFNLDTRRGAITEDEFRKLETKYSSAVVLVALNNLGVNTVDLLAGKRVGLPTLDQIKVECDLASKDLNKIIKSKSKEMWGEAACNYAHILSRPLLKEGIISGLSNHHIVINNDKLRGKVMIDCSWGSQGFIATNEPFDAERLVSSLVSLVVMKAESEDADAKVHRRLGASDASSVMTHVSRILSAAVSYGDNIWLSTEDLMTLVCIVLAHKNLVVVDETGSDKTRIHRDQEIKQLLEMVQEKYVQLERNKRVILERV